MKKLKLRLQMFADGDGAGASEGTGSEAGIVEGATEDVAKGEEDLSDVVYGRPEEEKLTDSQNAENTEQQKDKSQLFEELIKGEYKDEFSKRTQGIIDKRFKEAKKMEGALKSHEAVFAMLADRYGVDAKDVEAITKALENDDSFYEEGALEQGLTVEQYKHMRSVERENAAYRNAIEEQKAHEASTRIYAQWEEDAKALSEKYGVDINLESEIENEDFLALLASPNISFESAYKAIHMDDLMGGAMAAAAKHSTEKLANSIKSRAGRPSENGISPNSTKVFRNDPSKFTTKDFEEIERRVARGEVITL